MHSETYLALARRPLNTKVLERELVKCIKTLRNQDKFLVPLIIRSIWQKKRNEWYTLSFEINADLWLTIALTIVFYITEYWYWKRHCLPLYRPR